MREGHGTLLAEDVSSSPTLRLTIAQEPWFQVFVQNLRDLFRREVSVGTYAGSTGVFWPDVFVEGSFAWRRFLASAFVHVFAIFFVLLASQFLRLQPQIIPRPAFKRADVIYYSPSEYLPPLDTRQRTASADRKADPEIAKQPIISLPAEARNRSQTIVTPPKVLLPHDVSLPNTVAWSHKPEMPIAPAPVVPAAEITRLAPQMRTAVITPPPAVQAEREFDSHKAITAPQPSVIAPAPELSAAANIRYGEINIAPSAVIAPAPQLSVNEQRTADARRPMAAQGSVQVIAPPPAIAASGGSRSGKDLIALSLRPSVAAPPSALAGSRRGAFAATPEGHEGATGEPGSAGKASGVRGSGAAGHRAGDLPAGLYVGKNSNSNSTIAGEIRPEVGASNSVNPKLIGNARPPRIERSVPASETKISEAERAVFGDRKIYSLTLNMPNLNSGGGSWIIRFAALNQDSDGTRASHQDPPANELSSPVATRKVDPAYPLELMRENVAGTVILYGIIGVDGNVKDVRILRSVDDRLDRFAREAIAKWQFQPATRNGAAVDVEATFWIPFRPVRRRTDF